MLVVPVGEWSGTTESEAGARAGRAMRLRMGMRWDNTSYPNAPKLNTAKGRLTDFFWIFYKVEVGDQRPFRESPKLMFGQADQIKAMIPCCFPNSIRQICHSDAPNLIWSGSVLFDVICTDYGQAVIISASSAVEQ